MNLNSGYSGYSMSRRAVNCYDNGFKPLSKFCKADVDQLKEFLFFKIPVLREFEKEVNKKLTLKFLKENIRDIADEQWHHTSKYCNKTYFYKIDYELEYKDFHDFYDFCVKILKINLLPLKNKKYKECSYYEDSLYPTYKKISGLKEKIKEIKWEKTLKNKELIRKKNLRKFKIAFYYKKNKYFYNTEGLEIKGFWEDLAKNPISMLISCNLNYKDISFLDKLKFDEDKKYFLCRYIEKFSEKYKEYSKLHNPSGKQTTYIQNFNRVKNLLRKI